MDILLDWLIDKMIKIYARPRIYMSWKLDLIVDTIASMRLGKKCILKKSSELIVEFRVFTRNNM